MNEYNCVLKARKNANATVMTFESFTEFAGWVDRLNKNGRQQSVDWAGGTFKEALKYASGEKPSPQQAMVEELVSKIDGSFRDRERSQWAPSVAGAYPVVPEFLQGVPECMRLRQLVEDEAAPLRIVASAWTHNAVSTAAMAKRGAAVGALAMRVGEMRPVELWVSAEMASSERPNQSVVFMIKVNTLPMSVADLAAAMATPCVFRQLIATGVEEYLHPGINDGLPLPWEGRESIEKYARIALDMQPSDVYVGPLFNDDVFDDPVGWVEEQIAKQRELA